jgi:hypothetical protein
LQRKILIQEFSPFATLTHQQAHIHTAEQTFCVMVLAKNHFISGGEKNKDVGYEKNDGRSV